MTPAEIAARNHRRLMSVGNLDFYWAKTEPPAALSAADLVAGPDLIVLTPYLTRDIGGLDATIRHRSIAQHGSAFRRTYEATRTVGPVTMAVYDERAGIPVTSEVVGDGWLIAASLHEHNNPGLVDVKADVWHLNCPEWRQALTSSTAPRQWRAACSVLSNPRMHEDVTV